MPTVPAIRSFMLPVGFSHSSLAKLRAQPDGDDPAQLDECGVTDGMEDVHSKTK